MAIIDQAVNKRMHDINFSYQKNAEKITYPKRSGYGRFSHDMIIKKVYIECLAQKYIK